MKEIFFCKVEPFTILRIELRKKNRVILQTIFEKEQGWCKFKFRGQFWQVTCQFLPEHQLFRSLTNKEIDTFLDKFGL